MDNLVRDVRLAVRTLARAPTFAVTSTLLLAAGFFVIACTFAVTNAYLVRTMPFPSADRLVHVSYAPPGEHEPRGIESVDWGALSDVVEWADVGTGRRFALVEGSQATEILGFEIPSGSFEALNIRLAAGRTFAPDEYLPGASKVIIAAPHLMRGRSFTASTPTFLNLALANSGDAPTPYLVIGVLEPNLRFARNYARGDIEFVIPQERPRYAYMLRLRTGVPMEVAARRVSDAVRRLNPPPGPNWPGVQLSSVQRSYVQAIRPILMAVTVAAGLILLIVAANVAVLVLLRALRRERELAVRVALGAGAREIARMLGAEAAFVCGTAAAIGLALAAMALRALGPVIESQLGRPVPGGVEAFNLDGTVLLVLGLAALAVAMLLALAPLALPLATRLDRSLKSGARAGSDGPGVRRMRTTLVAFQISASLALLFGGGLVVRSVSNLLQVDFGYDAADLTRVRIRFPNRQFPDSASMTRFQLAFESAVLARTGSAVGFATVFPFYVDQQQRIETGASGAPEWRASVDAVGSQYFSVVGMELRAGRVFDARDNLDAERVAIVSETLARRLWPNENAVGKQIRTGADMNSGTHPTVWRTVVGVVNDVRETHRDNEYSNLYLPAAQMGTRFAAVFGRPGARTRDWYDSVRAIALELNPSIDLGPPAPLAVGVATELAAPRFLMAVLAGLALLAAAIALVGIYGVTAYAVEQRRRELAVRSALGATPRALVALFMVDGGRVVGIGIATGVVGALWLGGLLRNQVFGVASMDPAMLAGTTLGLAAACLVAAWLPARRAAALDAATVLRAD